MADRWEFSGVAVAAVTPFTRDGEIDERRLVDLVDWWIDEGVDAVLLAGSTGEAAYLEVEERLHLLEMGVEAVRDRVPVILGAGFPDTRRTLKTVAGAAKKGAAAALVVTPYYHPVGEREIEEHYKMVARSSEIPILLYNMPAFTGINLEADLVIRLSRETMVAGIKDSSGNLEQMEAIIEGTGDDFCSLSGSFTGYPAAVAAGAHGAILAAANGLPKTCREVYHLAARGDIDEANRLIADETDLQEALKKNGISGLKHWLSGHGHPAGYPRKPLLPVEDLCN